MRFLILFIFMKLMLLKKVILVLAKYIFLLVYCAKGAFKIVMKVCFGPTYERTFLVQNVRENCHFLNHIPTPVTLHNN